MGNAPSTSFLARSGLLGLMMLPLAALSLWSVRLIPQDALRAAEISDAGTTIRPETLGAIVSTSCLVTRRADGPELSRLPGLLQGMGGDIRIGRGPSGETMFTLLLPIAEA
jgi:hypothetical protein